MRVLWVAWSLLCSVSASAVDETPQLEVGAHVGRFDQPASGSVATGLTLGVRISKLATVEWDGTAYPVRGNYSSPTVQLVGHGFGQLADVTEAVGSTGLTARLSPVHGTISRRELPFDLHALVGVGVIGTADNMNALQCNQWAGSPCAQTARQLHLTTALGVGLRLGVSERVAARIEARKVLWVEVLNGVELQNVAPLLLQASTTISVGALTRRKPGR